MLKNFSPLYACLFVLGCLFLVGCENKSSMATSEEGLVTEYQTTSLDGLWSVSNARSMGKYSTDILFDISGDECIEVDLRAYGRASSTSLMKLGVDTIRCSVFDDQLILAEDTFRLKHVNRDWKLLFKGDRRTSLRRLDCPVDLNMLVRDTAYFWEDSLGRNSRHFALLQSGQAFTINEKDVASLDTYKVFTYKEHGFLALEQYALLVKSIAHHGIELSNASEPTEWWTMQLDTTNFQNIDLSGKWIEESPDSDNVEGSIQNYTEHCFMFTADSCFQISNDSIELSLSWGNVKSDSIFYLGNAETVQVFRLIKKTEQRLVLEWLSDELPSMQEVISFVRKED